jgi:hypothetical protein
MLEETNTTYGPDDWNCESLFKWLYLCVHAGGGLDGQEMRCCIETGR